MAKYYSTPKDVIQYTGITPDDIGIQVEDGEDYETPQQKLEDVLETWLIEIKDLIDTNRNRDYHQEVIDGERDKVPAGLHMIAKRMASNAVAMGQIRRQTSVVQVDQFQVDMVEDKIFTNSIKKDLRQYSRKSKMSMTIPQQNDEV